MLANYHTHTTRCQHAHGTDEEYVLSAIANGLTTLGFSDHGPYPYTDYRSRVRMTLDQRPEYVESLRQLKRKYQGQIEILIGYEYEYFPEYLPFLRAAADEADYLLLGSHFERSEKGFFFGGCKTPEEAKRYADLTIEGMETGLYAYLAHPDFFLYEYQRFDEGAEAVSRQICEAAKRLHMPLEYNLYGVYKKEQGVAGLGYPCPEFWKIAAETGCDAIIGCDAHWPEAISAQRMRAAADELQAQGLHVVPRLTLSKKLV
ncbi:MAG: histidinol-phosphatase [Eubacteriales bacterium]|nr:histidinol-phosphatase [Eubacteriales bacterium]